MPDSPAHRPADGMAIPVNLPGGDAGTGGASDEAIGIGALQLLLPGLEQAADAVLVADEGNRVLLFNAAAARLWGRAQLDVVGTRLEDLIPLPWLNLAPDDPAAMLAYLEALRGCERETLILAGEGTTRLVSMSMSTVVQGSRQLSMAILRPVTELRQDQHFLELLAQVADRSASAIVVGNGNGQVEYVNRGFESMFGYALDDLAGTTPIQLLSGPHTEPRLEQRLLERLSTGAPLHDEVLLYARSGKPVWVSTAIDPVYDAEGALTGLVSVYKDVTESKIHDGLQRKVLDAMARDWSLAKVMGVVCREVEHIAPQLVVLVSAVDADGRQQPLAGPGLHPGALAALAGLPIGPHAGPGGLCAWRGRPTLVEDLRTDPGAGAHHERILAQGLVSCWANPIKSSDGRILGTITFYLRESGGPDELQAQLAEISIRLCAMAMERKQSSDRVQQLALHDLLTGLPNRIMFSDKASQALLQMSDSGESAALLLLNLDRFKRVNDSQGHTAGDTLLCDIGARLAEELGPRVAIGRYAGDEFVVLLPACSAEQAGSTAERLLGVIAAPVSVGTRIFEPSASVGVAMYPEDGDEVEVLLRNAEMAMNRSKADGGASFVFFSGEMQRLAQERVALESALVEALRDGGLRLHFQPQVGVQADAQASLYGVEALARWTHPELGEIPPQRFVEVAEDIGLVNELSHWVLRNACAQLAEWRRCRVHVPRLSVNMSPINFRDPELAAMLGLTLVEFGLYPSDLTLEITESVMLDPDPETLFNIEAIYAMGVSLSLDDFGTGYSSLSHLHRLPIHEIKLDKSFVRDIDSSAIARTLTTSVLRIGESLGMTVVAEGVETQLQHGFLSEQGCPVVQGYLLSRPLPADELEQWLQANAFILPDDPAIAQPTAASSPQ